LPPPEIIYTSLKALMRIWFFVTSWPIDALGELLTIGCRP